MKNFLLSLNEGIAKEDVPSVFLPHFNALLALKAIVLKHALYVFEENYFAGKLDVSFSGTGYLTPLLSTTSKDIVVEASGLHGGMRGDVVVAKRIPNKKSRRAKAIVVYIASRAFAKSIVYTKMSKGKVVGLNIKNESIFDITASQKSLKQLPLGTVLKIDNLSNTIEEVLGTLDDARIDEKISLALFDKKEFFSNEAEIEAKSHGDYVDKSYYPQRVDLSHLPFCTIDPVDAKDFDDAIYFDVENHILYVAIADVSEYVYPMGHIDKEAVERGFSIYFPHKSIPMLPRALSENICSLKPNVDRLAYTFKITLDPLTCKPLKEELFESIIHSAKRYTYETIDLFLKGNIEEADAADHTILAYLLPLHALTQKLRDIRLENAFSFRSSEVRMRVDEAQNLLATTIEEETPSHGLIEDCMLLANKAAAKKLGFGIFRTHESPSFERMEALLNDLALIGIHVKLRVDLPKMIQEIQQKADALNLREEVDKLIIKSQKKAIYEPENKGHFGLGFDMYTHFTSPIRRYSDLTLHRLLKAKMANDEKKLAFLLKDIDPLCEKISLLERESDKVAWDYMDRKFARYMALHVGDNFKAIVVETEQNPIAKLDDTLKGARIFLLDSDVHLLQRIEVKIVESNIATARIYARVSRSLDV
ncbi:RNB domain-containing ribonuclease [Sulfurospirillum barnesii]|uniref:Exoribonuclease R n=1 Tax=Sulfurospirillum barnesii (strain ATCC 700032 / DSM 10660 / SES-3) TaxID=760154 RepID=I3XW99_SULBS|nr:ribonuclease R family protein [Sulfurospirillum barnesii]AFL68223.1 exoribonuclease R [Sulfurospirillum barnesii SES-3]